MGATFPVLRTLQSGWVREDEPPRYVPCREAEGGPLTLEEGRTVKTDKLFVCQLWRLERHFSPVLFSDFPRRKKKQKKRGWVYKQSRGEKGEKGTESATRRHSLATGQGLRCAGRVMSTKLAVIGNGRARITASEGATH